MSTTTVRASSWAGLFNCAFSWEGTHLLGINKPAGRRALLGTAIHHGTAVFDQGRLDNAGINTDDASEAFVSKLHDPGFDVDAGADDLTIPEAEKIGLSLVGEYCTAWAPQMEYSAVELTVKPMDIDCGGGTIVTLTGTLDRSRIRKGQAGGEGILDIKSGGAAVQQGRAKTQGHKAQIGTYELLYEHTTGRHITTAAEILGMKTRGRPEIATGQVTGGKALMLGDEAYPGLIEIAAQMFRTGLFPPNPSTFLCSPKYCARWNACPYKS